MGGFLSPSKPTFGCCLCADHPPPPPDDIPTRIDDPPSPSATTPDLLARTLTSLIETQECNASIISRLQSELISLSTDIDAARSSESPGGRCEEPGLNLTLKVTSSNVIRRGTVLHLTEKGCSESQRKDWDGVTFFGFNVTNDSGEIREISDVVIPSANPDVAGRHSGRHFQIRYDQSSFLYFIKDLGKGFGVFMRLNAPLVLPAQTLVSAGESFLVLTLIKTPGVQTAKRLRVKAYSRSSTGEMFYLNPATLPYTLRIGRHQTCDVVVDDGLISKVQMTIECSQDGKWRLYDGEPLTDRSSRNGTWVYLHSEREVEDGMTFKVCGTVFEAELWRLGAAA